MSSGIPANKKGAEYTIPAVRLTHGMYLMDSFPIAAALEIAYPTPSLHLDWEKLQEVTEKTQQLSEAITPWWKAKVPRNLLLPRSAEYFSRTRQQRYNMPLDQVEKELATEDRWLEAKSIAQELGAIIKASGGPYYKGSTRKLDCEEESLEEILI
jgi:glutathione S-transferase